jgi:hypothetical protein
VGIARTIRSYIFWTYDRGSFHYDVMVTLILLFIFISPRFIDFRDKPALHAPHPTQITVSPDASGGFLYLVPASMVKGNVDAAQLRSVIEPIAGRVAIVDFGPLKDNLGHIYVYQVRVRRN